MFSLCIFSLYSQILTRNLVFRSFEVYVYYECYVCIKYTYLFLLFTLYYFILYYFTLYYFTLYYFILYYIIYVLFTRLKHAMHRCLHPSVLRSSS